ncbi:hypothetical protein GQ53DRAFT_636321 [Thozetella sp. PMI_491]|nr:hypothetical protein GQ53DRAFT_636321 [Thozetella sp. PMI_491]
MDGLVFAHDLTLQDRLLLQNLSNDIARQSKDGPPLRKPEGVGLSALPRLVNGTATLGAGATGETADYDPADRDDRDLAALRALNDPSSSSFEPTVFSSVDISTLKLHPVVDRFLLQPYIRLGQAVVRHPTDVVMLTHLLLYFSTSVPSAVYLFYHFSYLHGVVHVIMQGSYVGAYTLLMHQHIHMRGVLAKKFPLTLIDHVFPYITDPLMGHTWNSYFHHHVKHHHVEGNGPEDLSSTIRYQRDNIWHFLHYVGRFFLFVGIELPYYFFRKGRTTLALKSAFWEMSNMAMIATLAIKVDWRPTLFVFVIPFIAMRIGLMVGNWGQHAFVDADEPDSDYRSSISLIDVPSNRYCYNDGYHTSHHLNPLRHWRDHPVSFLHQKETYAKENALVFHNIDYIMITVKLMQRDYEHLAKCLVPIGEQINMTLEERVTLLKRHTRKFSEEEIKQKFRKSQ